jgi:hypothetical protein
MVTFLDFVNTIIHQNQEYRADLHVATDSLILAFVIFYFPRKLCKKIFSDHMSLILIALC